jgi:hypothetical protein
MRCGEVQGDGMGRAQQLLQYGLDGPVLLTAGLEKAEQNPLRVCSPWGAIAAPHLARYHHGPDSLFGSPVGGLQSGTVQEGKHRVALP